VSNLSATGCVHGLIDNQLSFEQFVWRMARQFGALVTMRDDPADAPIPAELLPDDFHRNALEESREKVALLSAMTHDERVAHGRKLLADSILSHQRCIDDKQPEIKRVREVIAEAEAWEPPTPGHEGLRREMLRQLQESISYSAGDYLQNAIAEAKATSPMQAFSKSLQTATENTAYHEEHYAEEVARTKQRNEWINQLRESLRPPHKAPSP
jgi:hypothetical protein